MGYYIVVGGDHIEPLATTYGWKQFKEWAVTLPLPDYFDIVHLAEHAVGENLADLVSQLEAAIKPGSPVFPTVEGVREIAADLADSVREGLRRNPESACAFVSDGMKSDDETEDEPL